MTYMSFWRCVPVAGLSLLLLAPGHAEVHAASGRSAPISLEDSVLRALDQNLSRIARSLEHEVAAWNVRRERAAFEPALVASARREENNRENTVEQFRSQLTSFFEEQNRRYDVGVEGQLQTGARYRFGYSLNDLSNNLTNNVVVDPFQNQYQSFLGATVTQPLLRGGGLAVSQAAVNLARAQERIELHSLRREMMSVAAQTEAAYRELAMAEALLEIRGNSVAIAERILEDNRERQRQGRMAETEVLQAEASLADRQTRRNEAEQQRIQAMSRLRLMLSDDIDPNEPELVTTDGKDLLPFSHDLHEAMQQALALQPDYLGQLQEIEQSNVRLVYAENQRWPQIDLVGSYGYNGLGDSASDSWSEVTGQDYKAWSVGLQLSVGLGGDRRQRSELQMARLKQRQALTRLKEVELSIYRSLQAGIQECRSLRENIESIGRIVSVRERLLENELERLNAGRSDSRSLFSIEEDLLQARESQVRAINEYQKAVLRLELASGLSLTKMGLDVVDSQPTVATRRPAQPVAGRRWTAKYNRWCCYPQARATRGARLRMATAGAARPQR